MNIENLKTITFDFWDTIFIYPDCPEILIERVDFTDNIFKKYGIEYQQTKKLVTSIYPFFDKIWHNEKRTPSTPEMMNYIISEAGIEINNDEFNSLVLFNETLIPGKNIEIIEGVKNTIIELSKKYKLAIISDTGFEPGRELRKLLQQFELKKYFDYEVFSNECGCSKPDIKTYQLAAQKTDTNLSQMLHIGDRENKDIKGAKAAGMKSILFAGSRDKDYNITTADYKIKRWNEINTILL